jgi:hypothetical protein
MAEQPVTAVIIDDHNVVAAGVRAWCAQADPRIELLKPAPACYTSGPVRAAKPMW